jgi:chromate reductase
MNNKPKILAFAGSLRKDSLNKKLIKIAVEGAKKAGAEVTLIDLKDFPLPIYDQDIEDSQGLPENALKLKNLFESHDGFLLSLPEYNSSLPAVFKNTIDWVSRKARPEEIYLCGFIDKAVTLMSASPGQLGGLRAITHARTMFSNVYSIVLPKMKAIPKADQAFDESGKLKDAKQQQDVMQLGAQLADFLKKYKANT